MNVERNEVSLHEVKFWLAINESWKTSKQLQQEAGLGGSTARMYCRKFVALGICDQAEVFPAHRYRKSDKAAKRNLAYVQRLEQAVSVFSEELNQTANGK